ncbi:hypothetical protein EW146_g3213 [Bondarzewia mesenterica]|uniref:Uncharacterized protein n=1 Tax=Bondarzewia mesenterica TaxID=1095465 RepID=A0A4S4M458_9AGAM|nr:hypothetical protein EW146_g3213 [Bondarzewia mesenterica]
MPAYPLLVSKLKEALSDHMKLLSSVLAEVEDYIMWRKTFAEYLKHLETLDVFVKDAEVNNWIEEVSTVLELITMYDWLEWGTHFLPQLTTLVRHECEVMIEYEKVYILKEHVAAAKVKEDTWLSLRLMLLDTANTGEQEADTEMTALSSETGGNISAVSNTGKGKGCVTKRKTAEVTATKIIPSDAPVVKTEAAKSKASGSSGSRLRLTAHSSRSSTTATSHFLKKSVDEQKRLASEVMSTSESGMSLTRLTRMEDTITWCLESNACKLAMVLAECEMDKRELEKVRHEIHTVKRALGIKDDE